MPGDWKMKLGDIWLGLISSQIRATDQGSYFIG